MKNIEKKLLYILPKYYNKPAIKKMKELLKNGRTHYTYCSPGNWRHNTDYYYLNNNTLFMFRTEWAWDLRTRDNFFKNWVTNSKKYHSIINLDWIILS